MGFEKIIDILNWAKDKLPIPNRLEGIKNEIDKLEKERTAILGKPATTKSIARMSWIGARIDKLNGMLKNSTNNS